MTQKLYSHFDDDYDFIHVVFGRSYPANRFGFATRNDVHGIGLSIFNSDATYGSAGRLTGIVAFPIPTMYDGISPSTFHEIGHRWMVSLNFPPLAQGIPHWPVSDLAEDIMGYSLLVNGQPEGADFDFTLQPAGGGSYQLVPNSTPKTFSDLAQYLMGMRPANQVSTHFVFNNQQQPISANAILAGPITNVGVNDVIAHYGARSPDFAHAQKCFRVATVLITPGVLAPPDAMSLYDWFAARAGSATPLAYRDGLMQGTALPFSTVTGGPGCLDPRIKRHILIDASHDGGVWWFPQSGPFSPGAPHQGKALADHLRGLGHTGAGAAAPDDDHAIALGRFQHRHPGRRPGRVRSVRDRRLRCVGTARRRVAAARRAPRRRCAGGALRAAIPGHHPRTVRAIDLRRAPDHRGAGTARLRRRQRADQPPRVGDGDRLAVAGHVPR